jgi:hypothetical protein
VFVEESRPRHAWIPLQGGAIVGATLFLWLAVWVLERPRFDAQSALLLRQGLKRLLDLGSSRLVGVRTHRQQFAKVPLT